MAKREQEIADLDGYFKHPDIQEETKRIVDNWKSRSYDNLDNELKSEFLKEDEISNKK